YAAHVYMVSGAESCETALRLRMVRILVDSAVNRTVAGELFGPGWSTLRLHGLIDSTWDHFEGVIRLYLFRRDRFACRGIVNRKVTSLNPRWCHIQEQIAMLKVVETLKSFFAPLDLIGHALRIKQFAIQTV